MTTPTRISLVPHGALNLWTISCQQAEQETTVFFFCFFYFIYFLQVKLKISPSQPSSSVTFSATCAVVYSIWTCDHYVKAFMLTLVYRIGGRVVGKASVVVILFWHIYFLLTTLSLLLLYLEGGIDLRDFVPHAVRRWGAWQEVPWFKKLGCNVRLQQLLMSSSLVLCLLLCHLCVWGKWCSHQSWHDLSRPYAAGCSKSLGLVELTHLLTGKKRQSAEWARSPNVEQLGKLPAKSRMAEAIEFWRIRAQLISCRPGNASQNLEKMCAWHRSVPSVETHEKVFKGNLKTNEMWV